LLITNLNYFALPLHSSRSIHRSKKLERKVRATQSTKLRKAEIFVRV